MAVGIVYQFGNHCGVLGFRLQLPTKRVKGPSLWQRVKETAYQLALGCMPCPAYGG